MLRLKKGPTRENQLRTIPSTRKSLLLLCDDFLVSLHKVYWACFKTCNCHFITHVEKKIIPRKSPDANQSTVHCQEPIGKVPSSIEHRAYQPSIPQLKRVILDSNIGPAFIPSRSIQAQYEEDIMRDMSLIQGILSRILQVSLLHHEKPKFPFAGHHTLGRTTPECRSWAEEEMQ